VAPQSVANPGRPVFKIVISTKVRVSTKERASTPFTGIPRYEVVSHTAMSSQARQWLGIESHEMAVSS
jgi:hypothetical protein